MGLLSLGTKGFHLLLVLLRLEYVALGVFRMLCGVIGGKGMVFILLFLIFVVCEGALGLSIVVVMSRSHGIGGSIRMNWGRVFFDKNDF